MPNTLIYVPVPGAPVDVANINRAEYRTIPGHPAYLIASDGRVLSLKKHPAAPLTPQGSSFGRGVWLRVTLDNYTYRLRDLVHLTWRDLADFHAAHPEPARTDDEDAA